MTADKIFSLTTTTIKKNSNLFKKKNIFSFCKEDTEYKEEKTLEFFFFLISRF